MNKTISAVLCLLLALYFTGHAAFAVLNWENFLGTRSHLIRYLMAPAALALVFALVVFLVRPPTRMLIGVYSLSLLAALYLVEAFLMHGFYVAPRAERAAQEVADGVDLAFTPNRLNGHLQTRALENAVMGHEPHSTIHLCAVDDGPVRLRTDRFGLNNPDDLFEQPVRIAVSGDSFVHGHCQPPGQDIVSVVRDAIPETANIGLTGTGPLLQLGIIGRLGAALQPEHLVACFYEGNDLQDLGGEMRRPWMVQALDPATNFGPAPAPAATLARLAELNDRRAAGGELDPALMGGFAEGFGWGDVLGNPTMLRNFAALELTSSMLGLSYGRAPSNLPDYGAILARKKEVVEAWGGRLHLCYLPTRKRFGLFHSNYAFDEIRNRVVALAGDLDIEVIDVTDAFIDHPEPTSLFASDGHFSVEGAALVGEGLAAYLTDQLTSTTAGSK